MSTGWKFVELKIHITEDLYEEMILLAKRQNASFSNNVSRLIRKGIEQTYIDYPNLKEQNHE